MKIERGAGTEAISFDDYKRRRGDIVRQPAAISKLKYRGPYGYGGSQQVKNSSSGSATNSNNDGVRNNEFLNALYDMGFKHAIKPETPTNAKILPFQKKSDSSE